MSNDNIYTKFGCTLFASMFATTIVHPFDVIKVSKQLNYKVLYRFPQIYKGYSTGLLRQVTYSTPNIVIYSGLLNKYKEIYGSEAEYKYKLLFGTISGGIGGLTGNPSEVLFVKALKDIPNQNIISSSKEIIQQYGYGHLFNGYKAAIMRSAVYNSVRLSLYSESKNYFQNQFPNLSGTSSLHFLSGSFSTIIAIIISNPIDVMKSRLQKDGTIGANQMIKQTFQHEGISGFYKGLLPSIMKSFPHSIISFMVLEKMTKLITGKEAL